MSGDIQHYLPVDFFGNCRLNYLPNSAEF